jgi:hypothetical protein
MAKEPSGALSALKVKPTYGVAIDEDDDVDEAMRRVMDAYTARQQRGYDPYLMAIGQGLLSSRGNFGEAVGMAAKSYEDMRAKLGQEEIDTSAANLQLAQSRRDQALLRKKTKDIAEMFGDTSGQGAVDDSVDYDALSFLEANGMATKDAEVLLSQEGIRPNLKLRETGVNMGDMKRYIKHITTYGPDDYSRALMEKMKLQNDRYTIQNGMRLDRTSGKVEFVQAEGLPMPGDKNIDLFIGGGTRKADQRTAMLYEFAQNQGPKVAEDFADKYIKNGTVPKYIVDQYNAQQSGAKAPAGGELVDEQQLQNAFIGLQLKSPSLFSAISMESGQRTPLQPLPKGTKLSPIEEKVIGSMFRLKNAKSEKDVSPFDLQVLNFLKANANKGIPLEGGAAEPAAAIKVATAAPQAPPPAAVAAPAPAAAPVPAVKAAAPAAAVVPTPAKAAAPAPAAPAAPAAVSTARKPTLPVAATVAPLPANPSAEDKLAYEARKATTEAQNRAALEQYKIEMEQYNKDLNRPKDVDAAVEKAGGEDRIKEAQKREFAVPEKLSLAKSTKYAALDVMKRVSDSPEAFGLLEYPGIIPAILTIAAEGARVGDTSVTIAGLQSAIFKASPGITETALIDRTLANKRLAELQLMYAKKDMTGQGAISDKERALAEAIAGSVNDNPIALTRRMMLLVERSDFEQRELEAFRAWRKKNPASTKKDIFDFQDSDELASVRKDYDKKMDSLYAQFFGKAEAKAAAKAASGDSAAEANRVRAQKEINRILGK